MKLSRVAGYFNRVPCVDAYTGDLAFKCQVAPYDDSRRDSAMVARRILSVGPDAVIPPRRVVLAEGQRYVLGEDNPDIFNGAVIRRALIAHSAPHQVTIQTLSDVCSGAAGQTAFGNLAWVKNAAFTEQGSELVPEYQFFLSATEPVAVSTVLTVQGQPYLVRAVDRGASGLLIPVAEQMSLSALDPSATVRVSTYNKVAGSSAEQSTTARVLSLRWQSLYHYGHKGSPSYGPDEQVMLVSKASVPSLPVGSTIENNTGFWRVSAVGDPVPGAWLCRVVLNA